MEEEPRFEVYGEPDATRRAFVELFTGIPSILRSSSKPRSSLPFSREKPRLGIGEEGQLYKSYELVTPKRLRTLLDGPKVTEAMLYFRFNVPGLKSKDQTLFLHWHCDASCYPRVQGVSELEMTLSSDDEKAQARMSARQFDVLLGVWERVILESDPHYGVFWKEGDQFVPTHIFITQRPEYIYQANYFGPKMIGRVGRERIMTIPELAKDHGPKVFPSTWYVKELPTEGILLYERSDPSKPGISGDQETLKRHLGIKDLNLLTF